MADSVEKALQIAAQASKYEVTSCSSSQELMQKCNNGQPMRIPTQDDVEVIKSYLLKKSLDAEFVEKIVNDAFMQMTEDTLALPDVFAANVSDKIRSILP